MKTSQPFRPPNPFKYGSLVEGAYYLDRPQLKASIDNFIQSGINVVLIGPRRNGKTSFVKDLLRGFEERGHITLYVDIYSITSHKDFLSQLLRSLRGKSNTQAVKTWFSSLKKLRPALSLETDPTGQISFSISAESTEEDIKESVVDALEALAGFPKPLTVCIDEFQKIAEIDDKGWLEAMLRTQMQSLKNVAFLFTGSKKSVIEEMLNDSKRPFYKSCQQIAFPNFEHEFTDWVMQRFETCGVESDRDAVEYLRVKVGDTPHYVQMVAFHLVAEGLKRVTRKDVEELLPRIVAQSSFSYETVLNTLSPVQQRAVRLAAHESEEIYKKELLKKYEINSGPSLASAVKALKSKGIIDEGSKKGKISFDDPMFALWLQHNFPER